MNDNRNKKASNGDITFYKGVLLKQIHKEVVSKGAIISIDEMDLFLKDYADLPNLSCLDMSHDQMQQLKEWSKHFAMSIGLDIDKNNGINFNF